MKIKLTVFLLILFAFSLNLYSEDLDIINHVHKYTEEQTKEKLNSYKKQDIGRYAIYSNSNETFMLDTATGAVWIFNSVGSIIVWTPVYVTNSTLDYVEILEGKKRVEE